MKSGLNTCAYVVGEPGNNGLSHIYALAEKMNIEISEALCDAEGEISAFRRLQDYIKLGLCKRLLLYDSRALGTDIWLRLENELFMRRNGVKLIWVHKPERDERARLANAVKLYFSPCHTWAAEHGDELPLPEPEAGKRTLPFGYVNENGIIAVCEPRAQKVRELFADYAEGSSFSRMLERFNGENGGADIGFLNNTLSSERYLGTTADSGYRLPGIISYADWFAACSRKMLKNRSRNRDQTMLPYFRLRAKGAAPGFYRGSAPANRGAKPYIDSDKLEARIERELRRLASDTAQSFYNDHVLKMRVLAEQALPAAAAAREIAEAELEELLESLSEGMPLEDGAKQAERLRNELHNAAFRLRRIETELELYSIPLDKVRYFFGRACMPDLCSYEEKRFIASAFIIKAAADVRGVSVKLVSPLSEKPETVFIPFEEIK